MNRCLLLLLASLLLLGSRPVRASHAQGGQLTYEALGNNRYRVTCRYFRDCSGIAAETSLTLNCRVGTPTTSCNSNDARNFTTTLVRGILVMGSPYCPSVPGANTCNTTSPYANYETAKYTADITLPPAAEWTLSVEINARPSVENIGGNTTLRFEATLNNQVTLSNGTQYVAQNTSPQYQDQDSPVPFAGWKQQNTLTFSTFEPDGDSLVYSLDRPLEACNQYSTYAAINQNVPVILDPSNTPTNPCVINMQTGFPTAYSPTYPLPSYTVTGSCPVKTAVPDFTFDPFVGSVTFTPAVYATTPSADGDNKYALVGKVTEYRKINGQYYKIGTVRREMLVIVIDCGPNALPASPTTTAGNPTTSVRSLQLSTVAGTYAETEYFFTDPNPADRLTVSIVPPTDPAYADMHINLNAPAAPVTVLNNGTATPSLKVRLRPDPYLAGRTYRIPVKVEDNACPIKGAQYYVLVLQALPRNVTATHTAAKRQQLTAYPTPFTDEVRFALPRPKAGAAQVLVFDQVGRLVDRLAVPAAAGTEAQLTWTPAASVPAGIYSARFADGQHTVRLVRVAP
ncbi:hypothetical protein EJV47_13080 [Hymenobacter gummosus]|uniref:T9SS type A sorting domain-containing protein n=1 Tax=Hymenobacter gummosus TaxID=1776032 RepID=A0A431U389_9BACT|nr:hypothetical protein [Hymenobacter gummosus]RTQ49739.1 hypothetical protein EJV47_13080 [Hymenobacter gummosus]